MARPMAPEAPHDDAAVLDESFMADPYQLYRKLREEGPVHPVVMPRGLRVWLVTRYAEAREALADQTLSKDSSRAHDLFEQHRPAGEEAPQFSESLAAHMLNSDPPDHTRLRKLVNKAFTSRRVEALRPRIEQITRELLDEMAEADSGKVDLLDAFAFPLPITVICELLGVREADRDDFRSWSNTIVSAADTEQLHAASAAMAQYLTELVAAKRDAPSGDMLSALVTARDDDDRLTETELVSMAFLLLVAGHETTVNLIGNGMLALLRDDGQRELLAANPESIPQAIEEFLRYEGPVNIATLRHTTTPVTFGDVEVPGGEFVLVSLASANRDPQRFAEPDELDVGRAPGGHLGFGHGVHYCVGAPLARMEAEVAFTGLLSRFPGMRLAVAPGELSWRQSTLMRGLRSLPVAVT